MTPPRTVSEWQAMESAPKDSTAVLGYVEQDDWYYERRVVVRWRGEYCQWSMPGMNGVPVSMWQPLPSPPVPQVKP